MIAASHRRLMDLLAGWEQLVTDVADNSAETPEARQAFEDESAAIKALYLKVAGEKSETVELSVIFQAIERLVRYGVSPEPSDGPAESGAASRSVEGDMQSPAEAECGAARRSTQLPEEDR